MENFRLETTAGQLRLALDVCAPVVETWVRTPILTGVLIRDGKLSVTDLDFRLDVSFAAKAASGSAVVVFKPLHQLVKALPADAGLTLRPGEKGGCVVSFPGGEYVLPVFDASEFPDLPSAGNDKAVCFSHGNPPDLRPAFEAVQGCISREETRYYLNGVCFSRNVDGRGVVVATDGHRLAAYETGLFIMGNPILPHKAVNLLRKLPAITGLTVYSANVLRGKETEPSRRPVVMRFDMPGVTLTAKLIDGTYPDWSRVVPAADAEAMSYNIDGSKLGGILRRLNAVTGKRYGDSCVGIALEHRRGQIVAAIAGVNRFAIDTGKSIQAGAEVLPVEDVRGKLMDGVGFNGRYLLDLVRTMGGRMMRIRQADAGSPARITGQDERLTYVLMPMRTGFALDVAKAGLVLCDAGQERAA